MRINAFFCELYSLYQAEIEDLSQDSDGKDVLEKRLKEKREQLAALLPMIDISPEMVAVAFHGALKFKKPESWEKIANCSETMLPTWKSVAGTVNLASWVSLVLEKVLAFDGGEPFWIKTCVLEFLWQSQAQVFAPEKMPKKLKDAPDGEHLSDEYDRNEDAAHCEDEDLGEAGGDWLEQQGFDSKKD